MLPSTTIFDDPADTTYPYIVAWFANAMVDPAITMPPSEPIDIGLPDIRTGVGTGDGIRAV